MCNISTNIINQNTMLPQVQFIPKNGFKTLSYFIYLTNKSYIMKNMGCQLGQGYSTSLNYKIKSDTVLPYRCE